MLIEVCARLSFDTLLGVDLQSKYKALAGDTMIFGIGNLLMKLMQLALMPVLTVALTAEEYGSAELLNNVTELAYPIVCLCIHDALFRFAITGEADNKTLLSSGLAVICITFPVFCLGGSIGYFIFDYQDAFWLVAIVVAMSFRQLAAQFSRGIGMRNEFAVSGIVDAVVLLLLTIALLLFMKLGPIAYLASLAVSHLVSTCYLVAAGHLWRFVSWSAVDQKCVKRMLLYSLPMIPNCSAIWFINLFNRYAVLGICGAAAAGLYTAAAKFPSMMNMVSTIFQQAWQIFASRGMSDFEREKERSFSLVFTVYSTLIMTLTSIAITMSKLLAMILLQGEFFIAWRYIPGLLVGAMLSCYSIYFGTLYNAAMKNKMLFITTAMGAVVNVALALVCVPVFGAWGAVFTPIAAYAIVLVIRVWDTRKIARVSIDVPAHLVSLGAIFVEAMVLSLGFNHDMQICVMMMLAQLLFVIAHYKNSIRRLLVHKG